VPKPSSAGDFKLDFGRQDADIANCTDASCSTPSPSLPWHRKERTVDEAVADTLVKVVAGRAAKLPRPVENATAPGN